MVCERVWSLFPINQGLADIVGGTEFIMIGSFFWGGEKICKFRAMEPPNGWSDGRSDGKFCECG